MLMKTSGCQFLSIFSVFISISSCPPSLLRLILILVNSFFHLISQLLLSPLLLPLYSPYTPSFSRFSSSLLLSPYSSPLTSEQISSFYIIRFRRLLTFSYPFLFFLCSIRSSFFSSLFSLYSTISSSFSSFLHFFLHFLLPPPPYLKLFSSSLSTLLSPFLSPSSLFF